MMSLPLTFVLSADTETDVRLIHHSPLGNLDCQWHWQTSGEIAPCGPCRSSGSSVIDRKSNSIPSRMLSWLTGSITAHVYSPGHLIQSLSDAAGLFPLLPKGGPRLDANDIPKVGEDWPGFSRFFFMPSKKYNCGIHIIRNWNCLGDKNIPCLSHVKSLYPVQTMYAQMVQPASSKVPGSMETMV